MSVAVQWPQYPAHCACASVARTIAIVCKYCAAFWGTNIGYYRLRKTKRIVLTLGYVNAGLTYTKNKILDLIVVNFSQKYFKLLIWFAVISFFNYIQYFLLPVTSLQEHPYPPKINLNFGWQLLQYLANKLENGNELVFSTLNSLTILIRIVTYHCKYKVQLNCNFVI